MIAYERTKGVILSDRPRSVWSKKKKAAKPFAIEHRYPKVTSLSLRIFDGEWHVYARYATAKQRDQAIEQLEKNKNHGWRHLGEFRATNLIEPKE